MSQAEWPRFMLRLPPDLKAWVGVEAERNGASINSEIVRSVRERKDRSAANMGAENKGNDVGQTLAGPDVAPERHITETEGNGNERVDT